MSATIVQLVQGSAEWHAHRAKYRNASETPAVLGVSPWVTPYQLWQQRTRRATQDVNFAMMRGTQLEPQARAAYEQLTGHVMQPLVLVDGDYSASLDGMTLDASLIVEIKCPVKGKDSDLWKQVCDGKMPEHYYWQVQHQLMVSGANVAHLYVFDGKEGVLLEQVAKPADWLVLRDAWDRFVQQLGSNTPPALTERDVVERVDEEWKVAATCYRNLKVQVDDVSERLESAKKRLVALAKHNNERGYNVAVSKFWKVGAIDYKKVPQLQGADLEQYRSPPRLESRVTMTV